MGDDAATTEPAAQLSPRALAPSAFLPAMVFEIGNGAVAPVVALVALHLGAASAPRGLITRRGEVHSGAPRRGAGTATS
jgi:hypothetical protein